MSEKFFNKENDATRKYFRLEGKGLELAEKLEQCLLNSTKLPHDLIKELHAELELFTAAYLAVDLDVAYPICPALHRPPQDPAHIYMYAPIDFNDGSSVQPKSGIEITDPAEAKKLDLYFADTETLFQHQSTFPRIYISQQNNNLDEPHL